jgi:hypothetical protein
MRKRCLWIQRLLAGRGIKSMLLPHTAQLHSPAYELLEGCAQAADAYVASTEAQAAADATCALRGTALAVLWQHARLNYLLPALAPVACIACAIHMSAGSGSDSSGYVACAQIAENVLWLRGLLAADLDDALGVDSFLSRQHVVAELERLVSDGVLTQQPGNSDSTLHAENLGRRGSASARGSGRHSAEACEYALAVSGKATAKFCVAALAPVACTYSFALEYTMRCMPAEGMPCSALASSVLGRLREACEGQPSAVGPVPSKLLVQHAIDAWARLGLLQAAGDAEVAPGAVYLPSARASRSQADSPSSSPTRQKSASSTGVGGRESEVRGGVAAARDEVVVLAAGAAETGASMLQSLRQGLRTLGDALPHEVPVEACEESKPVA